MAKDLDAYIADLHAAEETEQALRADIEQANQRAPTAEADANTAIAHAQQQVAEVKGRAEQLEKENTRLNTLLEQRLSAA